MNALRASVILLIVGFHVAFGRDLSPRGIVVPVLGSAPAVVDLFFVLSGFLVYRPFAVAMVERRDISIRSYLRNRALRILPLYYSVTVIAFVLQHLVPDQKPTNVGTLGKSLAFIGVYVQPVAKGLAAIGIQVPSAGASHVLTVAWTLDDEIGFYILMPLLFLAVTALVGRARSLRAASFVIAGLIVISLAYQAYVAGVLHVRVGNLSENSVINNLVSKFAPFGAGMLLANLAAARPALKLTPLRTAVVMAAGLAISVLGAQMQQLYYPVVDTLMGLGCGLLLAGIAFSPPESLLIAILGWTPLAFLGEISYGIYLWHGPILHTGNYFHVFSGNFWVALIELYVASVAIGSLTYFGVERPALRLKKRWAGRAPATPASSPS